MIFIDVNFARNVFNQLRSNSAQIFVLTRATPVLFHAQLDHNDPKTCFSVRDRVVMNSALLFKH